MNFPAKIFSPIEWQPGMVITEGVYLGMPEHIYFSTHAMSVSGLKRYRVAPALYRFGEHATTRSQALGKLWHTALLEPYELEKRYYVTKLEILNPRHKAYQEEEIYANGREMVKVPEWDDMQYMCASIFGQGGALVDVLASPDKLTEVSFFWWDHGVFCRGRADILIPRWNVAGDLKSCQDAGEDFNYAVKDWLYHWQDAFYRRGLRKLGLPIKNFVFFAIEKRKPFLSRPWDMPDHAVEDAERKIIDLLPEYKMHLSENFWPGYPESIGTVNYPERWLVEE